MEDSQFAILSALQKFKDEFTKKEAAQHLKHNPEVIYDDIEYIGQHLDHVLAKYYERAAPTEEGEYFKITPFATAAFLKEKGERETEAADKQLQSDLIQSTLDTNDAVQKSFTSQKITNIATVLIGAISLLFNN